MSSDTRTALREGLLTLDDTADTNRIWRAMDYMQLADLLVATPTGKALADVVDWAMESDDDGFCRYCHRMVTRWYDAPGEPSRLRDDWDAHEPTCLISRLRETLDEQ